MPDPPFLVPYPRDPLFTGRSDDLARLHALLRTTNPVGVRAAMDVGAGGVGVTRLVVEYAFRYQGDYPGGVYWFTAPVGWRGQRDMSEGWNALARRLGLHASPPSRGPSFHAPDGLSSFSNHLLGRPDALLICEEIDDPDTITAQWAHHGAPALPCRVLFTTRRRKLSTRVESVDVGTLPEEAALELFHSSSGVSAGGDEAALSFCRALGLLPLAITLAAAYLREHPGVSLEAYLAQLVQLGGLTVPGPTEDISLCLSERHKTAVTATLRSHWDAIESPPARQILSTLALLHPGSHVPRRRLELLTPSPLDDLLDVLVRRGLVEELAERTVRLHPLVHAFVLGEPADADVLAGACVTRMAGILRDPERLEREVEARGASSVMLDLLAGSGLSSYSPPVLTLWNLLDVLEKAGPVGWDRARIPGFLTAHILDHALFRQRDDDLATMAEASLTARRLPYLRVRSTPPRWAGARGGMSAGVAVTSDGQKAVSAGTDGAITLWDISSGRPIHTMKPTLGPMIAAPAIAGSGLVCLFASGEPGGPLTIWDLTSDRAALTLEGREREQVAHVAISRSGRFAAAVTNAGTVCAWDLTRSAPARSTSLAGEVDSAWMRMHGRSGLAVTEDGRAVVIATDGTLAIWRVHDERVVPTSDSHVGAITSVLIAPDGRRAASASEDGSLKLWDLETGRLLDTLGAKHEGPKIPPSVPFFARAMRSPRAIIGAALTDDGGFAVALTASREAGAGTPDDDNSLTIWDLATGEVVLKLPRERHRIGSSCCAVTPDRKTIVLAGEAELTFVDWVRWDDRQA